MLTIRTRRDTEVGEHNENPSFPLPPHDQENMFTILGLKSRPMHSLNPAQFSHNSLHTEQWLWKAPKPLSAPRSGSRLSCHQTDRPDWRASGLASYNICAVYLSISGLLNLKYNLGSSYSLGQWQQIENVCMLSWNFYKQTLVLHDHPWLKSFSSWWINKSPSKLNALKLARVIPR